MFSCILLLDFSDSKCCLKNLKFCLDLYEVQRCSLILNLSVKVEDLINRKDQKQMFFLLLKI